MIPGGERRVRYVVVLLIRDLLVEVGADGWMVGAVDVDARLSGSWK
jgi:hypothetical protein